MEDIQPQEGTREFGLSSWSVTNRTTVFVLMAIIIISGLYSYITVPKESFPEVVIPEIYIGTPYPGNSPTNIEKLITRPLEKEINTITGVDEISSTSIQGYSAIDVKFDFDVTPAEALRKVKDAVDKAKADPEFPDDLPADPNVFELNFTELLPVMNVNLSGDYSLDELKRYAEQLEEDIEELPEISKVDIRGVMDKEVEIVVDHLRAEAMQASFNDIANAIAQENVTVSGGDLLVDNYRRTVQVVGDFKTMEEIRGLVDETVKDPETADKLKAYYNQFCKRPTFNDHYLATFNRENVELVDVSTTQGVEAITERGIVANGKEYEVDCIIYASGFEITSSYERRLGIPIFGIGGQSIYEHWQDGMRSMHGLMVSGFPNLYMCGGGFVFQLGANYAHGIDVQAGHVAYTISELSRRGIQSANVSHEAEEQWISDQLDTRISGFVLGGSPDTCTPGYYNQEGTSKRYRDVRRETYSKGVGAYMKLLRDWRESNTLEGLELS